MERAAGNEHNWSVKSDMLGYIRVILGCILGAGIMSLAFLALAINPFGFSQMPMIRTFIVLFALCYLLASLISVRSRREILMVVTIPFITQFYNIALGWDVAHGATSPLRLVPMAIMTSTMFLSLHLRAYRIPKRVMAIWGLTILVGLLGMVMSMDLSKIGPVLFLLVGIMIPLFYCYIGAVGATDPRLPQRLQLALCLAAIMLMIGNIATVFLGFGISVEIGAGSIAGTRNMGDFNSIFTYLLLLWPFAFGFLHGKNIVGAMLLIVLLVIVVALGFSRTALFLTPFILAISLLLLFRRSIKRSLGALILIVLLMLGGLSTWSKTEGMFNFWYRRLDFSMSTGTSLINALQPVLSGGVAHSYRAELKRDAVELFTESPLIGHGWGSFRELSASGFGEAHSMTHDLLVETGLFGTGLFWLMILLVGLNLLYLWRLRHADKWLVCLFSGLFCLWLLAAHTLGAQLCLASKTGLQVNIINGILLVLFLRRDLMRELVCPSRPEST
ncbi:MAG: O-antigen ligase family protein [bacterium]|nr:O-antigen ligase family protein [bacterium]